jgi:histidine triad (HIT) family protein
LSFEESCVFCRIVRGQAPASIIYEDDAVMAFLDIRPLYTGHTLVIPKQHYVDIFDIPDTLLSQVYIVAKHISPAIKAATQADGISIIQQNGKAAGQDIFHLHVHVVPRFEGQKMPRFSELKEVERAQLDEMAKKVRLNL